MQAKYKILLIEDDKSITSTLSDILTDKGYLVEVAENAAVAQTHMPTAHLVIIDLHLPDKPGIQLLRELKEVNPEAEALIITGYADTRSAIDALNMGASAYLEKPVHPEQLVLLAKRALEKWQLAWELRRREQEIKGLTGLTGNILNERVRLLEEAMTNEKRLTDLYRGISKAFRSSDPLQSARELLPPLAEATDANFVDFLLIGPDQKNTENVQYFRGMEPFKVEPVKGGSRDQVLRTGKPMVDSTGRRPNPHPGMIAAGLKSMAAYPLKVDEVIYGILFLHSLKEGAFAAHEKIISSFADLCAIPLRQAILYRDADIARREWEATVNGTARAIAVVDKDMKIIRSNTPFCEMVGATPEQVKGKTVCELVHGKSGHNPACRLEEARKSGKLERLLIEESFLKIKRLDIKIIPVPGPDGKIIRFVHTFRNLDRLQE